MKDMRLIAIGLTTMLALSDASALANPARHRPSARVYHAQRDIPPVQRDIPPVRSSFVPPAGATDVSAGGYLSNGRSASEAGGG
jgi:hypothetical protein